MQVLFLTNNPNLGSTARILQSWLTLGRQAGVEGRVVVPRAGPFSQWLARQGTPHCLDSMPWPQRRWPLKVLWHAWRVARWGRTAQVIHCNEHDVYPFALVVRRFLKRPLVCHVRYRLDRGFATWAFGPGRIPDALLWTSQQQRADSAAAVQGLVPEDRQRVVYLGLDLETFGQMAAGRDSTRHTWGFSADELVLGTASALRPRKRIEDFIDMVARLGSKDPRICGVLAGDCVPGEEAYREKLLEQIRNTGLGRRFVWLGDLEPVEPFYHAIDLFVSTSEYETFGNSVCEAMACRRAVVAYRGGSVAEVVGDAGAVVETGALNELTARAADLLADAGRRAKVGEQARQRVADCFSPAKSLQTLKEIYAALGSV